MKTLQFVLMVLSLIMFSSCNGNIKHKTDFGNNEIEEKNIVKPPSSNISCSDPIVEQMDTTVHIKFSEFTLTISRMVLWSIDEKLYKTGGDSIFLYPELGETIEEQSISIETHVLSDVQIKQSYETSITIMNEGPHCDLTSWKHYYSDWKQLEKSSDGKFICEKYEQADWEKFPTIDIRELKEEVKRQCGDGWHDLVKDVKSPTEYPIAVGISRYFLRITGYYNDNGKIMTKIIVFEAPMGC